MVSCLIQTSPDYRLLPATRSLSQVTTSFIGPSAKASTCVLLLSYSLFLEYPESCGFREIFRQSCGIQHRSARANARGLRNWLPASFVTIAACTVHATIAMQFSKNRHRTRRQPKPRRFGCDARSRAVSRRQPRPQEARITFRESLFSQS